MLQLKPQQICQLGEKNRTESWEPRPFTAAPHTDSLPEEDYWVWAVHMENRAPLIAPCRPHYKDNLVTVRSSDFLSQLNEVAALSGQFHDFLHHFSSSYLLFWHHNYCYLLLSARPSYKHSPCDVQASHHTDTPTAEMIRAVKRILKEWGKCVFHAVFRWILKNTGFLKKCFSLRTDCVFSSEPDRGLSLGDSLVFCGPCTRTFALK